MKTLGKAIANKIALVLSQYFQLPPGYLMGVIPNHVPNDPRAYFEQLNEEQKAQVMKLLDKIEDDEDVQNVFHNMIE